MENLKKLDGWSIKQGKLCKDFEFSNFKQAFEFMTKVATTAEKLNHHPDWSNSYNKVSISLFTHSENKITKNDFELAKQIEDVYKHYASV